MVRLSQVDFHQLPITSDQLPIGRSSNGRTVPFGGTCLGSNPSRPAKFSGQWLVAGNRLPDCSCRSRVVKIAAVLCRWPGAPRSAFFASYELPVTDLFAVSTQLVIKPGFSGVHSFMEAAGVKPGMVSAAAASETATAVAQQSDKKQQTAADAKAKQMRTRNEDKWKIFSGTANDALAKEVCEKLGLPLGQTKITKFSDGETRSEEHTSEL